MVRIYNSLDYFKNDEVIIDNESFFNNIPLRELSRDSLCALKEIDGAEILDMRLGKIQTPYGITDIKSISTGCKTALNTVYCVEHPEAFPSVKAINVTECGWNALDSIFEYIDTHSVNMAFVLEHDNDIFNCKKRKYLINGKQMIDDLAFYSI